MTQSKEFHIVAETGIHARPYSPFSNTPFILSAYLKEHCTVIMTYFTIFMQEMSVF